MCIVYFYQFHHYSVLLFAKYQPLHVSIGKPHTTFTRILMPKLLIVQVAEF